MIDLTSVEIEIILSGLNHKRKSIAGLLKKIKAKGGSTDALQNKLNLVDSLIDGFKQAKEKENGIV